MRTLPAGLDRCVAEVLTAARTIEGYLSERDIRLLALLAACPTTRGVILEIGSFKGKSAIILAKAAALADRATIVAVDPFVHEALPGGEHSRQEFDATLRRHGVADRVDFHQECSSDLARRWRDPIRLLWIDGDHAYAAAKSDLAGFLPCLADGAVVAMHDVLHGDGPLRVFAEDVLLSPKFGPAGLSGSIGWSQFLRDPQAALRYRAEKIALYRRLARLVPYVAFDRKPAGFAKLAYKLLRWRVPHGAIDPAAWLAQVMLPRGAEQVA